MKLNSPFFVLLLLFALVACNTNNDGSDGEDEFETFNGYLNRLTTDTVLADKKEHAEKALRLSRKINDPGLYYQAVLYKLDYIIAGTYPDSTALYLDKLASLATKTANAGTNSAYILMKKAEYAFQLKQYQKAYEFYHDSETIFEGQNDSLRTAYNQLKMAEIQQIYNDYYGSEEIITETLTLLENGKEESRPYLFEAYNKLGISYTGLKNYDEAIRYYKKAEQTTQDTLGKKIIENNIALIYLEEKQYAKAIKAFQLLTESKTAQQHSSLLSKAMDNLGFSKFKNDGVSGLDLMDQALAIRTVQADEKGMVYSYLNLSHFHGMKNPKLALNYAQKAYALATKIGAIDHRLQALQLLTNLGGRKYNEKYFLLNDSVNNFRVKAKNQFAKMRFDATKERNENKENKWKQEKARIRNLIIGFILIGFIILVIMLYFRDKRRHKKEKQKQKQEDEYRTETRIAKKLHDELANDIFNTMTFAEIRDLATPENKEILLDNLDKIYAQTRNISKENNNIDTGEKYQNNLRDMLSGYGSDEVNIILKEIDGIEWVDIEASKKIVVYRVLQELLVNMKKHSQADIVLISFKKINKKIQINYSDNGVGMGSHAHLSKSGLQNVENRIQSIDGTITFDPTPEKGFKVNFSFNA